MIMTNMSTVVIRTQQMMTISSNNNTIMMRKQKANHRLPAPAIILVYGSESILVHQIALVLFGIPLVEVLSGTYKNVIILFFLLMFVILLARSDQIRSDQIICYSFGCALYQQPTLNLSSSTLIFIPLQHISTHFSYNI